MNTVWGRFFDGEGGQRLDVELRLDVAAATLKIIHPDLPKGSQYWPLRAIRALADQARDDQLILSLYNDGALDSALIATARLTVDDAELIAALQLRCVNLYRRDLKRGTGKKIAVYTGGAVGAVLLMIFVLIPAMANTLAALIPIEREVAYGHTVVNQMERFLGGSKRNLTCNNPEGLEALAVMESRLLATTDTLYDLNIAVFDHPMVNAFAAPGGQVVLMRGLIERASGPDEVAAVLAHEIGHVESRDVTRNALRVAGSAGIISMVFGDFTGGSAAVIVAEQLLNSSYTRKAEAEADTYARNMLDAADVSTYAMGGFFDSLSNLERQGPKFPVYLSSHPDTVGRAEAARKFAEGQGSTSQVISDFQWKALQSICDKPKAEEIEPPEKKDI